MEMVPSGDLEIDFETPDGVHESEQLASSRAHSGSVVRGSTRSKSKATQRDRLPFSVLREQWLKRWQCRFLFYEPVTSPDAVQFIGGRVTCASTESQAERFSNGPRPSATFLTCSAVVYPHFQACHPERSRGICCFFQPPPQPASNREYRA